MTHVRKKVVKEVLDSSIRDILEKHLGERFKLFKKEALTCTTLDDSGGQECWGIAEIESIWNTRHEIVHGGKLSVDRSAFERALFGCTWVLTFLSRRARDTFSLEVDSLSKLDLFAALYNTAQPYVIFNLQATWVASGIIGNLKMRPKSDG